MSPSIPMSTLLGTEPSVLASGGNPLSLNGVFLTTDRSIPIGVAQPFPNTTAVENWFGVQSPEAILGAKYFSGFIGADSLPSTLYFFQYNEADVAAYLRGGNLSALTLDELKVFSGTLIVSVDGRTVTSPNIDLSSATSFTNAATLIQTGLRSASGIFSGTGTVTNGSPILTVNTTVSGQLHIGDTVVGTDIPAATTILAFGTYTVLAGTGTVTLSANATGAAGPEAITVGSNVSVTYDSLRAAFILTSPTTGVNSIVGFASGTLAANIELTQVTGAIQSIGAVTSTPAGAMNAVVASTQNWASFTTVFEAPVDVAEDFADWTSTQSPAGQERFLYVEWDSVLAETVGAAPGSFGAIVTAAAFNGSMPNFDLTAGQKAAFICGAVASIDFNETQGRLTLAYKGQAGLVPDVTDATVAQNLKLNGYNFYGAYATANQQFQFLQPGSMPGSWRWVDAYVNQIAMNADFQLAMALLETQLKSIPYNQNGTNLIRGGLQGTIDKYLNFGAIQPGVPLSPFQVQAVNNAAGDKIDRVLSTVGYFLQILPASPTVRGLRGSPPMKFWYTDGGSVQTLLLATIDVQ